jgi:hypothetical protein
MVWAEVSLCGHKKFDLELHEESPFAIQRMTPIMLADTAVKCRIEL